MKRNPKIRLTKSLLNSILNKQRFYGGAPSFFFDLEFTPIIYTTRYSGKYNIAYQKRIAFRRAEHPGYQSCTCYLRFRGNAPIGRCFTLDEFVNSFYMVMDEKTGTPYFKYYKK